ncbi:DUF305 domain-containing protein [Micromonospora sp. S-DT3-3-22]|uniref:DUF305 domain-containing protein n=1 Tax=Micromonospora sp. S-DT3-3-22 TaxID=2755359 RepID=UPI002815A96E|nr:DUF305 domain-containing protein [Micromonospora sp. S-DT3-3-22]
MDPDLTRTPTMPLRRPGLPPPPAAGPGRAGGGRPPATVGRPGRRRRGTMVAVAALLLAGCAPAAPPATPAPAPAGATTVIDGLDLVFLHAMTAHQERTLAIVRAAPQRVREPRLRTLVAAIDATETDEVAQARRWISAAGPDTGHHRHTHPDPGDTPDPVALLRGTPEAGYDAALVAVLVPQQRQAAALARAHLAVAVAPAVRDLARRIDESRTAQLRLIATLPVAPPTP